ncbi:MFS transporter [Acinetobacter tianfuensis]|uniref:MFS transporter n=1 Tax=Acinetobacter tianfuensis TaxID=2419603 RepID=A0A3A8EHX1_9GAMM|nr:MFS transporter [Acinetobacter tianfuensis]RKG34537.1 MFS transporter [Acinetobacter tianfuensis]
MAITNTAHESLWNRSFILCLFNNLFLFIYYFATLTVLPIYILQDLGGTVKDAGLALTLFLVSSIAIRPFSGLIVQKIGKKRSLRYAGTLFLLFSFSYLLIDSLLSLLIVRFLHGFWFSILTTVNVPVVNDFIPEKRKGEGMGYFVMATNLGAVFGPLLALSIIQLSSFTVLFMVLTVVVSIGYIFCLTLNVQEDAPLPAADIAGRRSLSLHDVLETKVLPISLVAMLVAFSYSSITSFITAFTDHKNLLQYASIFFIVFALSMIAVRPWVGRRYDRLGPSSVIYPSFIAFFIGLVIVSFMQNQWILWLSAVFIGIGYGSLFPCMQTMAIQSVSKPRMGHAISTFFALFDIGLAVGSVLLGLMIAYFDFQFSYLFCAVMVLLTMFIYKLSVAPQLRAPSKQLKRS